MTPSAKRCPCCQEIKSLVEFYAHRGRPDGLSSKCKECGRAEQRRNYARNAEHSAAIKRKSWLKTQFGLTPADYDLALECQGGVCAICSGPPDSRWGRYHVDHDHRQGRVRGLLCASCNLGLGKFQDDPALLEAAAFYLRSR